jgi:hypothetical protein
VRATKWGRLSDVRLRPLAAVFPSMNTTTSTTHADRYFAPVARYFAPEARYFAPVAGVTASMSCFTSPARSAAPAPGPARPGVGWLRLP